MKKILNKFIQNELLRFLIAGGINTLFSYCCFACLMFFIGNKEIATTLSFMICIFFNYNMSAKFVFKTAERMNIKEILKFYAAYGVTYPLNLIHLKITVDFWGWNVYFSQFVTLFYLPFISYFIQKKFVFKKTMASRMENSGAERTLK